VNHQGNNPNKGLENRAKKLKFNMKGISLSEIKDAHINLLKTSSDNPKREFHKKNAISQILQNRYSPDPPK
jgi:hypothetical protein